VRSLTPPPSAVHDVQTTFGVVRVYQHGPDGGVPLVLLHCFWATSAMLVEHIRTLTSEFTIYTVDLLGQPGASVQDKSMTTAKHCAHCIIEVLDELSVDGVHLVGHSYGVGPLCMPPPACLIGWRR
jgi:pimeloyl-ACP methyl ester carboxylesterase